MATHFSKIVGLLPEFLLRALTVASENDRKRAEAVAIVLKALTDIPDAFYEVGSIQIVKRTDSSGRIRIQVRSRVQDQGAFLFPDRE